MERRGCQGPVRMVAVLLLMMYSVAASPAMAAQEEEEVWARAFPRTPLPSVLEVRLPSLQQGGDAAMTQFLREARQGFLSPPTCKQAKLLCGIDTSLVQAINSRHTGRGPGAQANEYVHEKQLYKGSEIMMPDLHDHDFVTSFLPHSVTKEIPYGKKHLPALLQMFQYLPSTNMSKNIAMSLGECEAKTLEDQKWMCARSLNELVDFVSSAIGPNSQLVWNSNPTFSNQKVKVVDVKLKYSENEKVSPVSCHNFAFPHALFYCHYIKGTKIYQVTLQHTTSGITKNRIAICHPLHSITTTSIPGMNPDEQDCHWIYGSHLMWLPMI